MHGSLNLAARTLLLMKSWNRKPLPLANHHKTQTFWSEVSKTYFAALLQTLLYSCICFNFQELFTVRRNLNCCFGFVCFFFSPTKSETSEFRKFIFHGLNSCSFKNTVLLNMKEGV